MFHAQLREPSSKLMDAIAPADAKSCNCEHGSAVQHLDIMTSSVVGSTSSVESTYSNFDSGEGSCDDYVNDADYINNCLQALTSHLAQLQLRLKQIKIAPAEDKNYLLQSLEEFACRPIPQALVFEPNELYNRAVKFSSGQAEMISRLREHLRELEDYNLTPDITRHYKTKKCSYLTDESYLGNNSAQKKRVSSIIPDQITRIFNYNTAKHNDKDKWNTEETESCFVHNDTDDQINFQVLSQSENKNSTSIRQHIEGYLLTAKNIVTILTQVVISAYSPSLGGGVNYSDKAMQHYGELRAKLEVSVEKIIDEKCKFSHGRLLMDEIGETGIILSYFVLQNLACLTDPTSDIVRGCFSNALARLLEHGLKHFDDKRNSTLDYISKLGSTLCPFSCGLGNPIYPDRSDLVTNVGSLLLAYYKVKKTEQLNNKPSIRLMDAFAIPYPIQNAGSACTQLSLIRCIELIANENLESDIDESNFCEFVCRALNDRMLARYIRLIVRVCSIIDQNYESWSYVKSTGFADTLKSLDRLSALHFNLQENTISRKTKPIVLFY